MVLSFLFLTGGCAHYQPQPLVPEQSATQLESRRLDAAGLRNFVATNAAGKVAEWPPQKWELGALTLAAFYFHPDLAVSRAQWRLAVAGVETAGGRLNPVLSAGPGYNFTTAAVTPWMPFGAVDLPIETAGKRAKRIAEAENISESARWNYISAAWQIRSGVRSALLVFSTAQQRAELLQKQLDTQNQISRRLQQRFEAGAIARSELVPAQMALNKTQLELLSAQARLAEARSRLAEALGLPLAALDGITLDGNFSSSDLKALNSVAARRAALLGRADIRAALADYAETEAHLRLEIAKQYPDVHLNPNYQFDQGDNKWTLGLTLELPVLNRNEGPIAEAKARRELSAAKFFQLQSQVIAAIDRATAGLDAAQSQLRTGEKLLETTLRQQQSVTAQVQAGATEPLDLLTVEMELNSVRLAQLDSVAQWQSAIGALEDALQRPTENFDAMKIFLPALDQKSLP